MVWQQQVSRRLEQVPALVWVGGLLAGGFVALAVLMVVGYALADPGGWVGAAVALGIVVPLVGLSWWALTRPSAAVVGLWVAALAPLGFGVWLLLDYDAAWGWEDSHGPLGMVLQVVVAGPAVALALHRARDAGVLVLVVALGPSLLAAAGAGLAGASVWEPLSVTLLLAPLVLGGVLFLLVGSPLGAAADRRSAQGGPD